jgi:ABC-type antimicrobial peptide transport system permease subunit
VAWDSVISCRSLATLPVLGSCPPGAAAVDANTDNLLFTDNPLFVRKNLPVVTHANPAVSSDVSRLDLGALLIKTANSSDLERVRTYLTNFNATILTGGSGNPTAWQMGQLEPETFGEMAQIRNNDDDNVERVVLALLALTLLVAACSLAVTVGGSVVDRKRPFTLLRLSGTPTSALRRVVLLEAMLPLLVASLVAAAVGVGVAAPVIQTLLPSVAHAAHPGPIYYVTMAGGLAVALAVTLMTLPLIGRMTEPDSARFE